MFLAVEANRWAAVYSFGVLFTGLACSACGPTDYYFPVVPRTALQDNVVVRMDSIGETAGRSGHWAAVDVTVRSGVPIRITTARLAPRSADPCEGGLEASFVMVGASTRWDRWSRVPIEVQGVSPLHLVFEGRETFEKLATEPSDLDLAFLDGEKSSCIRSHVVGAEPELAWESHSNVIAAGGLRYDGFFGAPNGIQGLLSIPIELVAASSDSLQAIVQIGTIGISPCSIAECGRNDRGQARAGIGVPLALGAKAWLWRSELRGLRAEARYEVTPLALNSLSGETGHLLQGPRLGLRWTFALPPPLFGMPRRPDSVGVALEPEIGLVRDGFSGDAPWSFALGAGILVGRL
jgi:hypothetical protein